MLDFLARAFNMETPLVAAQPVASVNARRAFCSLVAVPTIHVLVSSPRPREGSGLYCALTGYAGVSATTRLERTSNRSEEVW